MQGFSFEPFIDLPITVLFVCGVIPLSIDNIVLCVLHVSGAVQNKYNDEHVLCVYKLSNTI